LYPLWNPRGRYILRMQMTNLEILRPWGTGGLLDGSEIRSSPVFGTSLSVIDGMRDWTSVCACDPKEEPGSGWSQWVAVPGVEGCGGSFKVVAMLAKRLSSD
jgi:hypothetical protein